MLCRSRNILTRAGVDQLKSVAVNICLPMVLVSSFATAEYSKNSITIPLVIFLICCLALAVGLFAVRLFKVQGTEPYLLRCRFGLLYQRHLGIRRHPLRKPFYF
jgi:predicted permease